MGYIIVLKVRKILILKLYIHIAKTYKEQAVHLAGKYIL